MLVVKSHMQRKLEKGELTPVLRMKGQHVPSGHSGVWRQLQCWVSLWTLATAAVLTRECSSLPQPKDDIYPLLHPTMHCWTPSSDLYVGCEEGHFLTINTETLKVTVLQKVEEISLLGKKQLCPQY